MFTLLNPTIVFRKALSRKENSINIRARLYKRVLHKLNKQKKWEECNSNSLVSVYAYDDKECIVIHIKDEKLSNIIYLAVKAGIEIPSEFQNLKFITVDKNEQAVFAVFKGQIYDGTPQYIFSNLVSLADNFQDMLKHSGNVYIHYPTLYRLTADGHWLNALFLSIVFDPVVLAPSDIDDILNVIFAREAYRLSYRSFEYKVTYSATSFYEWLRMGVYVERFRSDKSNIPFKLEINIIRYILDNNYIRDIHDLFTYGEDLLAFENYNKNCESFVIDEKLFLNSITQVNENDDFIIYTNSDGYTFAKIKNHNDYEKIIRTLNGFTVMAELCSYSVLISNNVGRYIYFATGQQKTLKDTIASCYTSSSDFISLIQALDGWGKSTINESFWFYKDTDFLTTLLHDRIERNPTFATPLAVCFNQTNNSEPFNYKKVLFLVIKEYLSLNQISIEDIYSCEFVKILHPNFMRSLLEFLSSGIVNAKPQDETFNGLDVSQVEFVENISAKDKALLSRVAFFKDYTPNDQLKLALKRVKAKDAAHGCMDLDDCLGYISCREITKNSLKTIFHDPKLKGTGYLAPVKLIISKDITIDGNYKIVGIIWNYGRVKNAFEVIKANTLNTQKIYIFIHSLLDMYVYYSKSVLSISPTSNHLLISLDSNMPILYEEKLCYSEYNFSGLTPKEYYLSLMTKLDETVSFRTNYEIFDYNMLVPFRTRVKHIDQVNQFLNSVLSFTFCTFHNRWYIDKELCPVCKKVFEVVDVSDYEKNTAYEDTVARFYLCDKSILYSMPSANLPSNFTKEIRLGLENDLYKNFVGIKPEKLVKHPIGIVCNKVLLTNINLANIMPLDSFKHIQRLKAILVMYEKLLPHILNRSFICTSKQIFETMVMHKDFKGEILIPNLALLESSVILSDDEALKDQKAKKTLEIFTSYLLEYINSDEYLAKVLSLGLKKFVAIVEDIKSYTFNEAVIKNALGTYKNFCFTHMQPFNTSMLLCPLCTKDGIKPKQTVFKDKGYFNKLSPESALFDGGEADIYPYSENTVQKIFKPHVDLAFKSKILAKAMEKNPLIDEFNSSHTDIRIISASSLLYMKDGSNITLKGFVQEYINDSYKISNLKDKEFVREHGYTRKDIVEILIKVCKGIEFIHSIGGFIGDLNGGNILIRGKMVFIIDIDGMSFDNVKNCMYTNMYIYPPSAETGSITPLDDWYSLAVQSFYYLTYSHPFRGISVDDKIPSSETERMKLGLSILGEHQISPPNISIGWDFLPSKLVKYFLDTFEGKRRDSMLNILEEYFVHLKNCENMFVEKTFERNVKLMLSPDAYFDTNNILRFKERSVLAINGNAHVQSNMYGILVKLGSTSYFFDLKTEKTYEVNKSYLNAVVSIYTNALYYTSSLKNKLYVDEFDPQTGEMKTHEIKKLTSYGILSLRVDEENKFVFVEDNFDKSSYDVYCNSTRVYSISKKIFGEQVSVEIYYDELSKKRIVIFKETNITRGVIIEKGPEKVTEFVLKKPLSNSMCFYGNTLYYVGNGNIYFYNVNTGAFKSIECKYAKKDSEIYRFDNKFVITNKTTAYVYEKS